MFRGGQTADTKSKTQDQSDKSLIRVRWGSILQTFPFLQQDRNNRKTKIQKIIQSYAREASKNFEEIRGIEIGTKKGERDGERENGQWMR